jgi:O-antigen/teichoic acid export membrane protein
VSGGLTKQAGMLTGSRAIGQILNVLAGLLVVRALAQHDYGTYRTVILLYTTLYLVGEAAFAQSLYHYVPRERERARVFIGQAMIAALVMSALWTVLLIALAGQISNYFGNESVAGYMALLAGYLGLSLLTKVPEAGLVTLERTSTISWNIVIFEGLKFVLVVAALKANGRISWILWAMLLATAARLLSLLYQLRGEIDLGITARFREQWIYSATLWLPGVLNIAATYAHQYIVGHYFNPSDFAVYSVACFQVPFMGVLASSVNEVFLVRATRYASEQRRSELYQLWNAATRKSLLVYIPVTVGLAVLARPLIHTLFGATYVVAAPYFIALLWTIPLTGTLHDGMFRAYHRMGV